MRIAALFLAYLSGIGTGVFIADKDVPAPVAVFNTIGVIVAGFLSVPNLPVKR